MKSLNQLTTILFSALFSLATLLSALAHAEADLYFIHSDHLGTPQAMTDSAQNVVWKTTQTPFGETVEESGSVVQPLRFPGQYADQESGLSYNYYRDYDPSLGRYVQSDPIGLRGGLNTYAYVNARPIIYTDFYGLEKMNLFGPSDVIRPLYEATKDISGILDIYSHANSSIITDDRDGRKILTPSEASDMIKSSGLWTPGMPVRIYGCNAAQGENSFTEQLSELLGEGTIVIGADQPVFPNLLGGLLGTYKQQSWPFSRYPDRSNPGNWRAFNGGREIDGFAGGVLGNLLPINR